MSVLTGMLLLFVATMAIGTYIRRNQEKEVYDSFVINFGRGVSCLCIIAAGLVMTTDLPYIDKASHAFLPLMVGIIIITLIKNNKK